MEQHNLGEDLQSAYRARHSTETALLHVKNSIMRSIHNQRGVLLVLLDLSAAFDTVEHNILVTRMTNEIGLKGTALAWYKSYTATGPPKCPLMTLFHVVTAWIMVFPKVPLLVLALSKSTSFPLVVSSRSTKYLITCMPMTYNYFLILFHLTMIPLTMLSHGSPTAFLISNIG